MNITPETEPLGSEHQAEGLAQRALGLAYNIEKEAVELTSKFYADRRESLLNVVAILRHYAEILPKWQAVLDAEVVARRITAPDGHTSLHKGSAVSDGCFTHIGHEVAYLIIKPSP